MQILQLRSASALGSLMAATTKLKRITVQGMKMDKRGLRAFLELSLSNPEHAFQPALDFSGNDFSGTKGRVLIEVLRFSDAQSMALSSRADAAAHGGMAPHFSELLLRSTALGLKGLTQLLGALQERQIHTLRVLDVSRCALMQPVQA